MFSFFGKSPSAQRLKPKSGDDMDCLVALLRQEERYRCTDYLLLDRPEAIVGMHILEECANIVTDHHSHYETPQQPNIDKSKTWSLSKTYSNASNSSSTHMSSPSSYSSLRGVQEWEKQEREYAVNVDVHVEETLTFWRRQMLDWSMRVVQSFSMSHETVAMSFNILDRYVAKKIRSLEVQCPPITREVFQLYSVTCLYISVKVMERQKIGLSALVEMSRGFYDEEEIVRTEFDILSSLDWLIHPPTAASFCHIFGSVFPKEVEGKKPKSKKKPSLQDFCKVLLEIAVYEPTLVSCRSSLIAFAATTLAARLADIPDTLVQQFLHLFGDGVLLPTKDSAEFQAVYHELQTLYCG